MMDVLQSYSRQELLDLVECFAKNMLALDGVWFQSLEQETGMNTAMQHDEKVWGIFAALEGKRFKAFLQLPEFPGLEGLQKALPLHFNSLVNQIELRMDDKGGLIFRTVNCRVQSARSRKNLPWHPCRPVGLAEYSSFARAIDARILCEPLSCYPEVTDPTCACSWRFHIPETASPQ